MKIGILSFALDSFSVKRLRQAATKSGHAIQLLDANRIALHCETSRIQILSNNRPIELPDLVLARLGAASFPIGVAIAKQLELLKVRTLNCWQGIAATRDKFLTMQTLGAAGLPIPPSALVSSPADFGPAVERVGGAPVIVKLTRGSQGIGVMLPNTIKSAEAIFETMLLTKKQVLAQKYIGESKGQDVRAFVIGNRVVAAMRRVAKPGEFRSNFHRGGTVEPVKLSIEYEEVALKAAKCMGLEIAGVDMLESEQGPLVMELNSSPGLEGIEAASKVDVAGAIIQHLEDRGNRK